MFYVFIGGASASGKSSIAAHLQTKLADIGIHAKELKMDDYYHERPDGVDNDLFRKTTNFDVPEMLHLDRLNRDITELGKGNTIRKPILSFATNKYEAWEDITPPEVVIIEGIFAQYFFQNYVDKTFPSVVVNVTTESYHDLMNRRIDRDIKERNRTSSMVIDFEKDTVGPGFFRYTASNAQGADVYIVNKKHVDLDERNAALDASVMEIIDRLGELHLLTSSNRKKKPDVRDVVAKSHWEARGYSSAIDTSQQRFIGIFNGFFGATPGEYKLNYSRDWSMDILAGFITAMGVTAVAVALVALSGLASTAVTLSGAAMGVIGLGLFARSACKGPQFTAYEESYSPKL